MDCPIISAFSHTLNTMHLAGEGPLGAIHPHLAGARPPGEDPWDCFSQGSSAAAVLGPSGERDFGDAWWVGIPGWVRARRGWHRGLGRCWMGLCRGDMCRGVCLRGGGNLGGALRGWESWAQLLKGWMKTVAEAQNALACRDKVGKAKGLPSNPWEADKIAIAPGGSCCPFLSGHPSGAPSCMAGRVPAPSLNASSRLLKKKKEKKSSVNQCRAPFSPAASFFPRSRLIRRDGSRFSPSPSREGTTRGVKAKILTGPDAFAARQWLKSLSRGDLLVKLPQFGAVGTDSGFGRGKLWVESLAAG